MKIDAHTYVRAHQYLYYVWGQPVISDFEYDMLCKKHGIDGGGGSDLADSYSVLEREIGERLLKGEIFEISSNKTS